MDKINNRWLPAVWVVLFVLLPLLSGCGGDNKNGAAKSDLAGNAGMAEQTTASEDARDLERCPLTGEMVPKENLKRWPLAVMIENSPAARPQSGLDKADIIYEMLAEGEVTRFMALYLHADTAELGPVRSARPYFITRALDYNAIYVYCGGSDDAKKMVRTERIAALDEFAIGRRAFWRVKSRTAPHNLYTDTEKLRREAERKGYDREPEITPFKFLEEGETSAGGQSSAGPTIHFPRSYSVVSFKYDQASKLYKRFTGGRPHNDLVSGKQLTARNIIVQFVNTKITDQEGRRSMKMTGAGLALLFTGGQVYEGGWQKSGLRFRTVFMDEQGEEFKLNPGQTWIEVVPRGTGVTR